MIQKSEEAKLGNDEGLLDAGGEKGDEAKAFLKPLSRGVSATLTRILNELEEQPTTSNRGCPLEGGSADVGVPEPRLLLLFSLSLHPQILLLHSWTLYHYKQSIFIW